MFNGTPNIHTPTCVIIIVADGLLPNRHQSTGNHHADLDCGFKVTWPIIMQHTYQIKAIK